MAIAGRRTRKWCKGARRAAAATREKRVRGLEALLGPNSARPFFREAWEQRPELYRSSCDAATLQTLPRWRYLASIFDAAQTPPAQGLVFKDGAASREYASAQHAWLDGCSLIVNRADRVDEHCRRLSVKLRAHLPHAYVQLYATPPHAQAVHAHADDRDVFVVQLEGKKTWVVYADPPVPYPNNDEQAGKAFALAEAFEVTAPRVVETTLRRGDVLYVPRGFVHAATCGEDASLHATVAAATYDWSWAKLCASVASEHGDSAWLGRDATKIAARLEKYTYWRRCAAPALVCDGHGSKAWQRAVEALNKMACVVGVEPNSVVGEWRRRLAPHRAGQDAALAGRDVLSVSDRGVYIRRRRSGEGRDAVERDDRGGIQAREELQAVLPQLLGAVADAPRRVEDVWAALDAFGQISLAHVGRALGLLVACDASGARLAIN
jgi:hypothetical protein